jgi:hypothetical protein
MGELDKKHGDARNIGADDPDQKPASTKPFLGQHRRQFTRSASLSQDVFSIKQSPRHVAENSIPRRRLLEAKLNSRF